MPAPWTGTPLSFMPACWWDWSIGLVSILTAARRDVGGIAPSTTCREAADLTLTLLLLVGSGFGRSKEAFASREGARNSREHQSPRKQMTDAQPSESRGVSFLFAPGHPSIDHPTTSSAPIPHEFDTHRIRHDEFNASRSGMNRT